MKQRLTVHVKGVKAIKEPRKNKSGETVEVPVIKNTLAFIIKNEVDKNNILSDLTSQGLEITKHYLSNIN